jgi:ribosome biogenesis GTPase
VDVLAGIDADAPRACLPRGVTAALVGSSGAGKTTLAAHLSGSALRTAPVRADDDRGRHTTTHRELFVVPEGGVLVDTPGMRELQLWSEAGGDDGALDDTFLDVAERARECRFRDCAHASEPGCAVTRAVDEGLLDAARFASYLRLKRELAHHADRRKDGDRRATARAQRHAVKDAQRRKGKA